MSARDVIAQALALSEAATPAPWRADVEVRGDVVVWGPDGAFLSNAQAEPHWLPAPDGSERQVQFDVDRRDAEFIAAARILLPALAKALGDVLKPGITEPHEWLQGMKTHDIEGANPGNPEYMAHIERVLRAAWPDRDIPWGPICLAIILDRHVRATEDSVAITAALSEVTP